MNKIKKNKLGFSAIEGLLILIIIGLIGFVGWYVWHSRNMATSTYNAAATVSQKNIATNKKSLATAKNVAGTQTDQAPTKTFNFIDMTGWAKFSPTDKSFTVEFGANETYGNCSDKAGILLISMVYMDQSGKYSCGSIKNVVSPQNDGSLLLTKVAVGPSEQLWDKSSAQSISVSLTQGEKALRYDYTNIIDGISYETIEYDISYQGKSYVAVLHWKTSDNINNESGIRPDYFDTIVQKTLTFN